jgi:hypothetical protein
MTCKSPFNSFIKADGESGSAHTLPPPSRAQVPQSEQRLRHHFWAGCPATIVAANSAKLGGIHSLRLVKNYSLELFPI